MERFIGDPFNKGCHDAILAHLPQRGVLVTYISKPDQPVDHIILSDADYNDIIAGSVGGTIITDFSW